MSALDRLRDTGDLVLPAKPVDMLDEPWHEYDSKYESRTVVAAIEEMTSIIKKPFFNPVIDNEQLKEPLKDLTKDLTHDILTTVIKNAVKSGYNKLDNPLEIATSTLGNGDVLKFNFNKELALFSPEDLKQINKVSDFSPLTKTIREDGTIEDAITLTLEHDKTSYMLGFANDITVGGMDKDGGMFLKFHKQLQSGDKVAAQGMLIDGKPEAVLGYIPHSNSQIGRQYYAHLSQDEASVYMNWNKVSAVSSDKVQNDFGEKPGLRQQVDSYTTGASIKEDGLTFSGEYEHSMTSNTFFNAGASISTNGNASAKMGISSQSKLNNGTLLQFHINGEAVHDNQQDNSAALNAGVSLSF